MHLNASDIDYSYELRGNLSTTYTLTDIHYILMNVTIIDEYSLEFNFPEKNVFQENLLALPILPKHIWQNIPYENHKEQAELWATTDPTKLIGAGPYYLFNYNNDTKIVHLKRNDYYKNYTEINPHFENIYFKYYSNKESTLNDITSGKIDFIDPLFAFNFNDVPINASYSISHTGKVQLIAINNKNPWIGTGELCPISDPLSAQKIRTAISYSIPKQLIIDEVYNGLGSYGVTPWSNIALDFDNQLEPIEFDLDYAKYLLKYSGFDYGCEPAPCTTTSIIGLSFRILFVSSLISILAIRYLIKRKR
ncbi:MAG: hypothetical protein FK731_14665 [Asgard group archaeon]|nr:hypothetical protein [Asgard group archaeon]